MSSSLFGLLFSYIHIKFPLCDSQSLLREALRRPPAWDADSGLLWDAYRAGRSALAVLSGSLRAVHSVESFVQLLRVRPALLTLAQAPASYLDFQLEATLRFPSLCLPEGARETVAYHQRALVNWSAPVQLAPILEALAVVFWTLHSAALDTMAAAAGLFPALESAAAGAQRFAGVGTAEKMRRVAYRVLGLALRPDNHTERKAKAPAKLIKKKNRADSGVIDIFDELAALRVTQTPGSLGDSDSADSDADDKNDTAAGSAVAASSDEDAGQNSSDSAANDSDDDLDLAGGPAPRVAPDAVLLVRDNYGIDAARAAAMSRAPALIRRECVLLQYLADTHLVETLRVIHAQMLGAAWLSPHPEPGSILLLQRAQVVLDARSRPLQPLIMALGLPLARERDPALMVASLGAPPNYFGLGLALHGVREATIKRVWEAVKPLLRAHQGAAHRIVASLTGAVAYVGSVLPASLLSGLDVFEEYFYKDAARNTAVSAFAADLADHLVR